MFKLSFFRVWGFRLSIFPIILFLSGVITIAGQVCAGGGENYPSGTLLEVMLAPYGAEGTDGWFGVKKKKLQVHTSPDTQVSVEGESLPDDILTPLEAKSQLFNNLKGMNDRLISVRDESLDLYIWNDIDIPLDQMQLAYVIEISPYDASAQAYIKGKFEQEYQADKNGVISARLPLSSFLDENVTNYRVSLSYKATDHAFPVLMDTLQLTVSAMQPSVSSELASLSRELPSGMTLDSDKQVSDSVVTANMPDIGKASLASQMEAALSKTALVLDVSDDRAENRGDARIKSSYAGAIKQYMRENRKKVDKADVRILLTKTGVMPDGIQLDNFVCVKQNEMTLLTTRLRTDSWELEFGSLTFDEDQEPDNIDHWLDSDLKLSHHFYQNHAESTVHKNDLVLNETETIVLPRSHDENGSLAHVFVTPYIPLVGDHFMAGEEFIVTVTDGLITLPVNGASIPGSDVQFRIDVHVKGAKPVRHRLQVLDKNTRRVSVFFVGNGSQLNSPTDPVIAQMSQQKPCEEGKSCPLFIVPSYDTEAVIEDLLPPFTVILSQEQWQGLLDTDLVSKVPERMAYHHESDFKWLGDLQQSGFNVQMIQKPSRSEPLQAIKMPSSPKSAASSSSNEEAFSPPVQKRRKMQKRNSVPDWQQAN